MVKIPENFYILIISFDKEYNQEDVIENLFINQAGVSHKLLLNLDQLSKVSGKDIGLVIYIDRSKRFFRLKNFFIGLRIAIKCGLKKIPSLKIQLSENFEENILRIYNLPKIEKLRKIVDFLKEHLNKNYKISFEV